MKGALQAEIHGGRYYRVPRLLTKPGQAQDRELPEVVEERCINRSTVVTSQLPIENWHAALGDPTAADAILDRLVHTAHRLRLSGESMRRQPEPAPGNQ